jgi:two-component system, LytTR family, sensor kinase
VALGAVGVLVVAAAGGVALWRVASVRRDLGTPTERAIFEVLHAVSLAAPPLRAGLTPEAARRAARSLRALLGTSALAVVDPTSTLAWEGDGEHHREHAARHAEETFATGRTQVLRADAVACGEPSCPIRCAIAAPLTVDEQVRAVLLAYAPDVSAGLVRATSEVARWASGQLELAELDRSRTRLAEAEVRALRAQISPHFIYNALGAIASFMRTDPERARDLLLDFADFTRYSFRRHGEFTTLAEELRSINQYLLLEQARFGERLKVTVRVAPEVLGVAMPFLCLQPLVENAVRHGIEGKDGVGEVTLIAEDVGAEVHLSVEDNGLGADPEKVRRVLAGEHDADAGIGLGNVDERLRQVYGDDYGLVVETAPQAGMKVRLCVPKYRPGVHATPSG